MAIELTHVYELQGIRDKEETLLRQASELAKGELSDLNLIPEIYRHFNEIQLGRGRRGQIGNRLYRKQFVFLILYLFSPGTLAGKDIRRGVRKALAETLGFKSSTAITNLCADLLFLYDNHREFRHGINVVHRRLQARISGVPKKEISAPKVQN